MLGLLAVVRGVMTPPVHICLHVIKALLAAARHTALNIGGRRVVLQNLLTITTNALQARKHRCN